MALILTNGEMLIGKYVIPKRKKPCLCIQEGNTIKVYGTFTNEKLAKEFMEKLTEFVLVEEEEKSLNIS